MYPALCSLCMTNVGLRHEASKLGAPSGNPCPTCGRKGGNALSYDQWMDVIESFFVGGSIPPDAGGFAPIYNYNDSDQESARFDFSLEADCQLLREHLGITIFRYAPPFWRLGITEHFHALSNGSEVEKNATLDQLVDPAYCVTFNRGEIVYRVRANIPEGQSVANPSTFDSPPHNPARKEFGRFDAPDIPILYVSQDIEVCLHECRVTLSDEITVASLTAERDLSLLDLTAHLEPLGGTPFDDPNIFHWSLSVTKEINYPLCRLIGARVRDRGFDGFIYNSYYSQAKPDPVQNIAFFGYPIREEKLRIHSINKIRLSKMEYEFSFGPCLAK